MPKKKKSRRWLAGAALQNPVLVQAAGLTAVIVAAKTLQGALWISAITGLHLILCELLASVMKRVPAWLRVAVYFVIGLAISCPTAYLLDRLTANYSAALAVFMPLMAANALTAMRCERYAILHTPGDALRDAFSNAVGFTAAAVLVGGARELLGYGTLWGVQLSENLHLRGAWMPFGGFLLLGAMAGVLKVVLRALSVRGIYAGAEKALELAPEDRLERLEKTRRLLIADVKAGLEEAEIQDENEENAADINTEAPAPEPEPAPEEESEEEPEEEPGEEAPEERRPRKIPVDDILREYGLGGSDDGLPRAMTEDDKMRLVLELEELLDEFKAPGTKE
ncbi:MAG: hypothetical protein FWC27_01505 [Firmicutes bacterium]|nr:hypothetical protein [Bacillota bacterium]